MRSLENRQSDHHHSHSSVESPTLSEAKKKTIRSLQLGSLGLQTAGTVWEIVQNGLAAVNTRILLLMAHDVNDVAGWELDLRQDRGELSETARRRTEKMAHWAIAGGGAYTAVEGGAAVAGIRWHEGSHNLLNTVAAAGATGVAAATTGLVAAAVVKRYGGVKQLWQRARDDGEVTKDKKRFMHGMTDFLTAGAVLADTTELLSSQSSGVLAALGGVACMVYFRPTKKNLELGHVCAAHGHAVDDHSEHGHEHHHHHEEHAEQHRHEAAYNDKKQLRQRRAARLGGVAAAVVASGVIAGSIFGGNSSVPQESVSAPASSLIVEEKTVTVQSGDSVWKLVHEYTENSTGVRPSEAAVYNLVQMTAKLNSAAVPNPHLIQPGYSLLLPGEEQIEAEVRYN